MIQIDKKSLEGKLINQFDENGELTGVWVRDKFFHTFEDGVHNGWLFHKSTHYYWFDFYKKNKRIICVCVNKKNNKITKKTITI